MSLEDVPLLSVDGFNIGDIVEDNVYIFEIWKFERKGMDVKVYAVPGSVLWKADFEPKKSPTSTAKIFLPICDVNELKKPKKSTLIQYEKSNIV